jgi:hypothetical protein
MMRNLSRGIGYLFLAAGLAWLVYLQTDLGSIIRWHAIRKYDEIAARDNYTSHETQFQIRDFALELKRAMPWVITPGILMLLGAVVIDIAGKRN